MLKSKKSKSGRRKCSIKCFNADYAMPYDEGSREYFDSCPPTHGWTDGWMDGWMDGHTHNMIR